MRLVDRGARLRVASSTGDPSRLPGRPSLDLIREGEQRRAVGKASVEHFQSGARGTADPGPEREATGYRPTEPADRVLGVWAGHPSAANGGKTWATVEREAEWEYRTQGWASNPPAPTDPAKIGCNWFTEIDSRAPYGPDAAGGHRCAGWRFFPARAGCQRVRNSRSRPTASTSSGARPRPAARVVRESFSAL
ncbi:hypothetical protein [Saccharopolyspora pogona]|uniref:hypothetical protein n=1 Tax=Saccharopolyspora pogona TaxID=333966 RepID=UPI001685EB77|nr:hypothetical protein [Saccharopolyspora pogona]